MTLSLKPLPFPSDASEPYISAATVQLHHEHHEAGYVERVNRLVSGTTLANHSLEEIVAAARDLDNQTLFNMAAFPELGICKREAAARRVRTTVHGGREAPRSASYKVSSSVSSVPPAVKYLRVLSRSSLYTRGGVRPRVMIRFASLSAAMFAYLESLSARDHM